MQKVRQPLKAANFFESAASPPEGFVTFVRYSIILQLFLFVIDKTKIM